MIIKTITAARLINTGNYENTKFEATAEIEGGESAIDAMASLQIALVAMIKAEQLRRHPDPERRRYMMWTEEDEREQA